MYNEVWICWCLRSPPTLTSSSTLKPHVMNPLSYQGYTLPQLRLWKETSGAGMTPSSRPGSSGLCLSLMVLAVGRALYSVWTALPTLRDRHPQARLPQIGSCSPGRGGNSHCSAGTFSGSRLWPLRACNLTLALYLLCADLSGNRHDPSPCALQALRALRAQMEASWPGSKHQLCHPLAV